MLVVSYLISVFLCYETQHQERHVEQHGVGAHQFWVVLRVDLFAKLIELNQLGYKHTKFAFDCRSCQYQF